MEYLSWLILLSLLLFRLNWTRSLSLLLTHSLRIA
jgi:hypothetical protein